MMHDELSIRTLRAEMGALAERYRPCVFDEVESTNAEARLLALAGEEYALVTADSQSAGRGRLGRSFYSPVGTGVYVSILHTFQACASDAVSITSAAAVAVLRAILRVCEVQTEIKWVNDLYWNGKKVAGILAEAIVNPTDPEACAVILGIGINLRPVSFPPPLDGIATTLSDEKTSRAALIAAILKELTPYLEDPTSREWLEDYRRHSCVLGREIVWMQNGVAHAGTAVDIDSDGALLVKPAEHAFLIRLSSGEITLRLAER